MDQDNGWGGFKRQEHGAFLGRKLNCGLLRQRQGQNGAQPAGSGPASVTCDKGSLRVSSGAQDHSSCSQVGSGWVWCQRGCKDHVSMTFSHTELLLEPVH